MQEIRQKVTIATLAAVSAAEWMIFVLLPRPMCAFMPKDYWFSLRVWLMSGSRTRPAFFVWDGA
jgi:hypothetical protein